MYLMGNDSVNGVHNKESIRIFHIFPVFEKIQDHRFSISNETKPKQNRNNQDER